MRREGQLSERRHLAQIQPRPLVERSSLHFLDRLNGTARTRIGIANPGGAATMWFAFIQVGEYLFFRRAPVPAHYRMPMGEYEELSSLGRRTPATAGNVHKIVASYAIDAAGGAWDVLTATQTELPLVDYLRDSLAPFGIAVDDDGRGSCLAARPMSPRKTRLLAVAFGVGTCCRRQLGDGVHSPPCPPGRSEDRSLDHSAELDGAFTDRALPPSVRPRAAGRRPLT